MSPFNDCPGSRRIKTPFPEEIKCQCGYIVEIWSDETSEKCAGCGNTVTRGMLPSCLDWCAMAKECVGPDKYERHMRSKKETTGKRKERGNT